MSLMYFKTIEVGQFLQFRDKVVIENLDAGLNVIAGDNEAGKSTLLHAIRTVLFDRHTSTVGEKLAPYNAKVSPRVGLVFEVDGVEYQLNKVFSKKKDGETTLKASDGKSWEGQAAEEHIAGLLGFSYAARGQSKVEHQGLAGLLWVEQSKAYEPVLLSDQSRQQIHSVFENEMREMLGGSQGEQLHKCIIRLRGEYFDVKGNSRSDYKRLQIETTEVQRRLEEKKLELNAYEDKVDRLEKQQKELAAYQEDNAQENAKRSLDQAKQAIDHIIELQNEVKAGEDKVKRVEAECEVARNAWDNRTNLIKELTLSENDAKSRQDVVAAKEAEIVPRNKMLEDLQSGHTELLSRRSEIETKLRRARDIESLQQLSDEFKRLEKVLKEAKEADSERRRCISELGASRVTEATMKQIRKIERTRDLTQERLNAVATQLQHQLMPDASIQLGDDPLSGEGSVRLTEPAKLEIKGMGTITIIPGGEDLQVLQREMEEHNHQLQQKLAEAEADCVENAEEALRRSKYLESHRSQYEATINGLAPDGIQALEDQHGSVASRREKLLSSLGDISSGEKQAGEIEIEADSLQQQIKHIEDTLNIERKVVQKLREDLAAAKADAKTAVRNRDNLTVQIEQVRREINDDTLEKELAEAEKTRGESQRSLKTSQQALDNNSPEFAEAELDRAKKALNDISQNVQDLERDIRDLKVELTTLGQKGLAEEVASLESEYGNVKLQFEQVDNRARALDLLQHTLDAALQQAKEAVAQPITDKLIPYLKQLIPGAAPLINEDLVLTGIQREGADEPFTNLSGGVQITV